MAPTTNPRKRPAGDASANASVTATAKGQAFRKSAAKKARVSNHVETASKPAAPSTSKQPLKSAMKQSGSGKTFPQAQKPQNEQTPKGKGKQQKQQPRAASLAKPQATPPVKPQVKHKDDVPRVSQPAKTPSSAAASSSQMAWIHPPAALPTFRIMTGSYERLLYGLKVTQGESSTAQELDLRLQPIFQFPAHPSSIKCLATGGAASKYLVTAGQDELIKIWDLRRKKEVGSLSGAESFGPPIAFEFPLSSHLLLTAEGVILLYRTRDWALLHTFKGHTGRVNFISTHPSARLALSGGQDGVLRAWDLMRGKSLGGTKMGMGHGGEMERLKWFGSNKGLFFALLGRTVVRIFRKSMAEVARIGQGTLTSTRLNDVAVWDVPERPGASLILVAREDKKVGVYLFEKEVFDQLDKDEEEEDDENNDANSDDEEEQRTLKEIAWLEGHEARVKAVSVQPVSTASGSDTLTATTISSDGHVRIFNLHSILETVSAATTSTSAPASLQSCASYSTKGARLTCLSTCGGDGTMKGSRAEGDFDDDSDEDGDVDGDASAIGAASEDESDFVSDFEEGRDAPLDEEGELRKLEEVLKEAKKQGIDLDLLVNGGLDDGEDDDDDDDDDEVEGLEEEETEGENEED